jgi:hypothetical protein
MYDIKWAYTPSLKWGQCHSDFPRIISRMVKLTSHTNSRKVRDIRVREVGHR